MKKSKNLETLYFIGGLFPREREDEIRRLTKSGLQSAANNLQWKFVKGYDSCLGTENVRLITRNTSVPSLRGTPAFSFHDIASGIPKFLVKMLGLASLTYRS